MDVLIAFIIFTGAMAVCLMMDGSMLLPLLAGFICFFAAALHRGFSFRQTKDMALKGAADSLVVIRILLLIGMITALWRSAGTISFFVYYGMKIITPSMFIIITFLLACLLSYALGTSFGVAGTVGVIFMALARSGGVSEAVTAGAVMSGIYFGDRGSPASSSASLTAAVTHTDLYGNVKMMMKTGLLPLVLPLLKVRVITAMALSILSAAAMSIFVQKLTFVETVWFAVFGYRAESGSLTAILSGGGMASMLEVCGIVLLSCSYSGIFRGTGMLGNVQALLERVMGSMGKFGTTLITSIAVIAIFCNQTIAAIMCSDLLGKPYEKQGAESNELAIDMENSLIVIAGLVPWAIACAVPLKMLGAGISALPYAVLLYLIPLCYIFTKKIWYPAYDHHGSGGKTRQESRETDAGES